jgi:DNA-binding IscR family transcriptional regulator
MTHELWAALNTHIYGFLRGITLAEMVRRQAAERRDVVVLQDQRAAPQPADVQQA